MNFPGKIMGSERSETLNENILGEALFLFKNSFFLSNWSFAGGIKVCKNV